MCTNSNSFSLLKLLLGNVSLLCLAIGQTHLSLFVEISNFSFLRDSIFIMVFIEGCLNLWCQRLLAVILLCTASIIIESTTSLALHFCVTIYRPPLSLPIPLTLSLADRIRESRCYLGYRQQVKLEIWYIQYILHTYTINKLNTSHMSYSIFLH